MISLRLEEQLEKKLEKHSEMLGVSKSELVRLSLQAFLDKMEQATPYELGRELFGRFKSGDGTLSQQKRRRVSKKIHAKKKVSAPE